MSLWGTVALATTFAFDAAASSIHLTKTGGDGHISASGTFLDVDPWDAGPGMETHEVSHLIHWQVNGGFLAEADYDVTAKLHFTQPGVASGQTTGDGNAFVFLYGLVNKGSVSWHGPANIDFGGGYSVQVTLDSFFEKGLLQNSLKTGGTFKTTTPVPLPAAGWLLLAGLGGMAAMKRRSKAA
ncbi:MAG: VPLPA-CTERM sorting domain-containing protein [Silicimonas sp.]|nr:VPLPA-CTERM sorting domain-containing protein [Silicimonas sp.]